MAQDARADITVTLQDGEIFLCLDSAELLNDFVAFRKETNPGGQVKTCLGNGHLWACLYETQELDDFLGFSKTRANKKVVDEETKALRQLEEEILTEGWEDLTDQQREDINFSRD